MSRIKFKFVYVKLSELFLILLLKVVHELLTMKLREIVKFFTQSFNSVIV